MWAIHLTLALRQVVRPSNSTKVNYWCTATNSHPRNTTNWCKFCLTKQKDHTSPPTPLLQSVGEGVREYKSQQPTHIHDTELSQNNQTKKVVLTEVWSLATSSFLWKYETGSSFLCKCETTVHFCGNNSLPI